MYALSNPARYYGSIEISEFRSQISNSVSGKSYVRFENIEFRRGWMCISLDNCDYITFDNCKILGGTSTYGLRAVNGSDYGTVQNNCIFDREDMVEHSFSYGGGPILRTGRTT